MPLWYFLVCQYMPGARTATHDLSIHARCRHPGELHEQGSAARVLQRPAAPHAPPSLDVPQRHHGAALHTQQAAADSLFGLTAHQCHQEAAPRAGLSVHLQRWSRPAATAVRLTLKLSARRKWAAHTSSSICEPSAAAVSPSTSSSSLGGRAGAQEAHTGSKVQTAAAEGAGVWSHVAALRCLPSWLEATAEEQRQRQWAASPG